MRRRFAVRCPRMVHHWRLLAGILTAVMCLGSMSSGRAAEVLTESSDSWGYTHKIVLIDPKDFDREYLWELGMLEMVVFAKDKQKLVTLEVLTEKRYPLMGVNSDHHVTAQTWLERHMQQYSDKSARAMFIAFREGGIGWWIRHADGRVEKDTMGGDPWVLGEGEMAGEISFVGHNAASIGLNEAGRLKRKYYPMFFVVQRAGLNLEAANRYNEILRERLGDRNYELVVSDNEWNPHLVGYPYLNPFAAIVGPPPRELVKRATYILCGGVWRAKDDCSVVELDMPSGGE